MLLLLSGKRCCLNLYVVSYFKLAIDKFITFKVFSWSKYYNDFNGKSDTIGILVSCITWFHNTFLSDTGHKMMADWWVSQAGSVAWFLISQLSFLHYRQN